MPEPSSRQAPEVEVPKPNDAQPFACAWLDSCYQETTLPHAPWHQLQKLLLDGLATEVTRQLAHPQRAESIFQLLGQNFREAYFPDTPANPGILEPPEITPDRRAKLNGEAMSWLQNALNRVSEQVKAYRPHLKKSTDEVCPEMVQFTEHTRHVVDTGLHRELLKLEKDMLADLKSAAWDKYEASQPEQLRRRSSLWWEAQRLKRAGSSEVKGILKDTSSKPASVMSTDLPRRPDTGALKASLAGPQLWGMQSDQLGEHVIQLLRRDPRRFNSVAAGLTGKQLPPALRCYVWLDTLLKKERERLKDGHVERVLRERFGQAVARGMGELSLKRATHSPINSLIDTAVIEKYDSTPSMYSYLHDNAHQKETCRVLNVLYTYNRSYEPYLIYWLFPLQLAFRGQQNDGAHVYELSMYLSLLGQGCFPTWPAVYAAAESTIRQVSLADPELGQHLNAVAQVDPQVNYKDFLVDAVNKEKSKASVLLQEKTGGHHDNQLNLGTASSPMDLLADPVVFVRRWIGDCFVSVLDTSAVLWAWDQFFLTRWHPTTMENLCIALVMLLRHHFLAATNYAQMKQVFLKEPCKLYTQDIQRAWCHLSRGGSPTLIPSFNRLIPPERPISSATTAIVKMPVFLPAVGLKHIAAELVIHQNAVKLHPWVEEEFQALRIRLQATIFFGSVRLASLPASSTPLATGTFKSNNRTVHTVSFPSERIRFDPLDVSQLDVEWELQGRPWVVLTLTYRRSDTEDEEIPLGWTRLRACWHTSEKEAAGAETVLGDWGLISKDERLHIHPGPPPDKASITGMEAVLRAPPAGELEEEDEGSILSSSSILALRIWNPDVEEPSPAPRTPSKPPTPAPRQSAKPKTPPNPDNTSCVDFYIDAVHNLPDSCGIIKVTGRMLRMGDISSLPDILAYPDLQASARSPELSYRMTINPEQLVADPDMLAFLRVYTVDRDTGDLVVVGSCLVPCFDEQNRLLVGTQEHALYSGKPGSVTPISSLKPDSLDQYPRIPACRLYLRLLPHSQEHLKAPESAKQLRLPGPELNSSELKLIESYKNDSSHPAKQIDMAESLQEAPITDPDQWIQDRLDNKKQLKGKAADHMVMARMIRYRPDAGVNVQLRQVYRAPAGKYVQCFGRILPKASGEDEKFITQNHDYQSSQTAPQWNDQPQILRILPPPDAASPPPLLLIQLFGLQVTYKPDRSHQSPGNVTNPKGGPLALAEDTNLGWAVLPVLDRSCVWTGEHHIPVFKGRPSADVQKALMQRSLKEVLKGRKDRMPGMSVKLDFWDGHLERKHVPYPLPKVTSHLSDVGASEPAAGVEEQGPLMSRFVLDSLEKKYRRFGTESDIYKKEEDFFRSVVEQKFYSLMENALLEIGYGPL